MTQPTITRTQDGRHAGAQRRRRSDPGGVVMQRTDHRETDPHVLAGRLTTGWLVIEAERDPTRKQRLEDHWIQRLHRYEVACAMDMGNRREPRPEFSDHLQAAEGKAWAPRID